ncbi:MAG TPA: TIGR03435 family protein [Acidobacteriaceae bacterium]|jgi:uncharacterized protein (TIGR03435 family)
MMTKRILLALTLLSPVFCPTFARSFTSEPAPAAAAPLPASPAFDLADVHVSAKTTAAFFTGGSLRGDRYLLHNATMVDMISLAYGVDGDNILSGPSWLDFDRFDVSAHAPRGTSPDDVKLMLQSLLTERFHLAVRKDTHPIPAYVLRVDRGGLKMKPAAEGEASNMEEHHTPTDNPPGVPAYYSVNAHNRTMEQTRQMLQDFASQYLPKRLIDATGLKGGYDFGLHWTWKPVPDGLTIFDAVQKQLGLKLALEQYPTPVLIVEKADETPTANLPGLEKVLPPPPPSEFDVSVLTPSRPDAQLVGRINGNQVNATGMTLKFLIGFAYNLNSNDDELIQNAPKFVEQDRWDILAKAAPEAQSIGPDGKPQLDFDLLPHMIQTMLAERFQMKSHFEDRTIEAFTLVAVGPRMKKADPVNRTSCKEGPGPDGKDPRIADPILGRLLYCQNVSMAQLAEMLPNLAGGYVFTPVKDATGLQGGYDFTLSFSTAGQLHSAPPPPSSNDPSGARTTDPNGGLSLPDAMARQLGVKLIKEKRPSPVLIIDHIEEKPTDN